MSQMFDRVALIGIGLIGSSLAHVMRKQKLAGEITGYARSEATRAKALEIGLVDRIFATAAEAVKDADLIILCSPVGTYGALSQEIGPALKPGSILTDVGSVKGAVVRDVLAHVPEGVHLIPGHPIAGTGAILIGTALDELERTGGRYALITMCAAGGMAPAIIIERV